MTSISWPARAGAGLLAALLSTLLTACVSDTGVAPGPVPRSSVEIAPATSRLREALALISEVVAAVAPGAPITDLLPGRVARPQPCTGAERGLVYYRVDRQFQAPDGGTGADLVPRVGDQFAVRGFTVRDPGPSGGWTSRAATTGYLGVTILGAPDSPIVRIGLDTRCGLPAS